jgi:hypothetical protein
MVANEGHTLKCSHLVASTSPPVGTVFARERSPGASGVGRPGHIVCGGGTGIIHSQGKTHDHQECSFWNLSKGVASKSALRRSLDVTSPREPLFFGCLIELADLMFNSLSICGPFFR